MATWKCPKCGYVNVFDKQDYCSKCGTKKDLPIEGLEQIKRAQNLMVTTTPSLDGYRITEYFGIISSVVVLGTGFFSEFGASISDFTGGRASGFQKKLDNATKAIMEELADKATNRSPEINALVGLKLDYTVAEKNMMILCGTATAVKYEKL